jgi:hypothetical protein
MSRIRANKITNKLGTGAVQLEKGAEIPVGMGITGAGSINLSGIITAATINATTFQGVDSTALKDSADNVKIQAQASGAVYTGIHTFGTNTNFTDVDVDGHTNLDNVSISGVATVTGNLNVGGVLTYEDVTNVDSVGLVTARDGVFLPDTKELKIGNTAASPDLKIHHTGGFNKIEATTNLIIGDSSNNLITMYPANGGVNLLYTGGHQKLATTLDGVIVTGIMTATSFVGDGSGLTGLNVGLTTEALTTAGATVTLDLSKDDHKITKSGTYTITCTGGTESESHTLRIVNSGTATVSFSDYFLFPSGGTPNLPTASGAISLISFTVHREGAVGINTQLLAGASVNFS